MSTAEARHELFNHLFRGLQPSEQKAPTKIIPAWNDAITTEGPTVNPNQQLLSNNVRESLYTPKSKVWYRPPAERAPQIVIPQDNEPYGSTSRIQPMFNGHGPHWLRNWTNPSFQSRKNMSAFELVFRTVVLPWTVRSLALILIIGVTTVLYHVLLPLRQAVIDNSTPPAHIRPRSGLPVLADFLKASDVNISSMRVEGRKEEKWLTSHSRDLASIVLSPRSRKDVRWESYGKWQMAEMVREMNFTSSLSKGFQPSSPRGGGKHKVLLVGDDNFESWNGTQMGDSCVYGTREMCRESHEYFRRTYRQSDVIFSAIHGDTTDNILYRWHWLPYEWRDSCGPVNDTFPCRTPTVVVIQVGAADLDSGRHPEEIAAGIRGILIALMARFRELSTTRNPTHYVLTGILPRAPDVLNKTLEKYGTHTWGGKLVLPANYTTLSFRESQYYSEIKKVNAWLQMVALEASTWHEEDLPSHPVVDYARATPPALPTPVNPVAYTDCGHLFLADGDGIPLDLMPDMRHLSAEGNKRWMECVHNVVGRIWKGISAGIGGTSSEIGDIRINKLMGG